MYPVETATPAAKTIAGRFFEDFRVGQTIVHATPRTLGEGDAALMTALYGNRFALQSSAEFARVAGYERQPLDDLLVFHTVFGKSVPDISLNAVANLGYAECRFLKALYAGDTLSASSQVIGVKPNSSGKTGTVYVRTTGCDQSGATVLEFVRWVMVRKRDEAAPAPQAVVPSLAESLRPLATAVPPLAHWDTALSGSVHAWEDYAVGERIDHVDGMTIEEADHMLATRTYQNTAKVHFNQHTEGQARFGRRLVYGGHIISLVRSLSFNGLGNAFHITGINAGRHVAPAFAGDTIYAWSEVVDKAELDARSDIGALRIVMRGIKNRSSAGFPDSEDDGLILELDYWAILPRRAIFA